MTIYRNRETGHILTDSELDAWYDGEMDPELNPKQPYMNFDRWLLDKVHNGVFEVVE